MSPRRILPALLRLRGRVRAQLFAARVDDEVREELDFHVRMRARELEAAGMGAQEALREAARRIGERERVESECRTHGRRREARVRAREGAEAVGQDVRFALRQLRRHPGFALTAVATLALAIGANTAVFSAVRGVLLRPLPYRAPEELIALHTRYLPISGFDLDRFPLSPPELDDYRAQNRSLAGAEPYLLRTVTLGGDEGAEPLRLGAALVSAGLFPLLGVEPALGRPIGAEEDVPGAPPVVLLSHELWRSRFGGDPAVVGRAITVGGRGARVVGVMPEGFVFPTGEEKLWSPLALDRSDVNRAGHFLRAVGRLAPGTSLEAARVELGTIAERWAEEHPHNLGHFVIANDLAEDLVGDVGSTLLLLQLAVALVLLVACANLAGLSLSRAEARRHELALRASLGAGRGRIARQLLTEALVLSVTGAALGWALAAAASRWLTALDPLALPRGDAVRMDGVVLAFSAAVAVGAALLFGALPALRAGRSGPGRELIGPARGGTAAGSRRLQSWLVAAEVALSVVVVAAAALTARSAIETLRVDSGVRVDGLLTAAIALPTASYPEDAQVQAFYDALEARVAAAPGVAAVSAVSVLPLSGSVGRWDFFIEGRPAQRPGERMWSAVVAGARPGYFETAGIPLLAGRPIAGGDRAVTEPVVWVSRRTAELFWPGEDPVGALVAFTQQPDAVRFRVAGVVGGTPPASLQDEPEPQVYFAHAQMPLLGGAPRALTLVVRTSAPGAATAAAVRAAVREQDARLPVPEVLAMEEVVLRSAARPRLIAGLLGAFGLLALALAAVGVYGIAAYGVARRTREIGIRVALGARAPGITALVLAQGMVPVLAGVAAGLAAAFATGPRLEALLFRVSPRDPATLAAIPLVLVLTAVLAIWVPARRALRIAPTEALREE